jgi:2-polyprenyl-3-methyl-5-hydroxy-6-metoxy-1,4-benzoquinol methylase
MREGHGGAEVEAGRGTRESRASFASWPAGELEQVDACPVCSSAERDLLYDDLKDDVLGVAPGTWILYRCRHCGAGYLDPRPSRQSIGFAYEKYHTHVPPPAGATNAISWWAIARRALANGYRNGRYGTTHVPSSPIGSVLGRMVPAAMTEVDAELRFLPRPRPGARVLDVGCGNGAFLERARQAGWQASGVDIDPVVVAQAKAKGLDVLEGGIEQRADGVGSYDAVTMSHVIEHVHRPVETLRLANDLLVGGGLLWIETPNIESPGHARYGRSWRGIEAPRHLVVFSLRSIEQALHAAGFRDWRRIDRPAVAKPILAASEEILRRGSDPPRSSWRMRLMFLMQRRLATPRGEYLTLVARKSR